MTRLFARIGDIGMPMKEKGVRQELEALLHELLQECSPRIFNQALMEFGALVCTPANPDCPNCPLRQCCLALQAGGGA